MRFAAAVAIALASGLCAASGKPVLRLATHDLPPYSYPGDAGEPVGLAVEVVKCAAGRVGQPVEISIYPWARAQALVKEGAQEGFFAASHSPSRDEFAVMSAIIAPQEWRWYYMADNPMTPLHPAFRDQARVGSFHGGNMLDWLRDNGYRVDAAPSSNPQALQMLLAGRVDAILANNLVMEELLRNSGRRLPIRSELLQDKPLGVYFSKTYLQKHPEFLGRFNAAVAACRRKA